MAKNRRESKKYPAVDVTLNLKTRYEEISDVAEYFDTLPEDAKEWMHSFVEEYINAKFNHKGKKIHRKTKQKREIYNRNNARNRDILTQSKACGKYVEMDNPMSKKIGVGELMEDYIVAKVDQEREKQTKKSRIRKKSNNLNCCGNKCSPNTCKSKKL